ncbi:MAG: hypothetical protein JW742_07375, partial [Candidatus Aminicenantes bacterium]|nr:hypothetical protein [Candidatus Aminicenantes bacterium]
MTSMLPVWKRRLRRTAMILGTLSALVVALILIADTGWIKRRLIGMADRKLRADYGLSLEVGRSRLRLAGLSVSLHDVRVQAVGEGPLPVRSFTAAEISLDLAWAGLVRGPFHVQDLRVVRPRIEIAAREKTRPRVPAVGASEEPRAVRKPFSFRIDRFALLEGEAVVEGRARSFTADFRAIELSLGYRSEDKDQRGTLSSGEGRVGLFGSEILIAGVESAFELDDDRIVVNRFVI